MSIMSFFGTPVYIGELDRKCLRPGDGALDLLTNAIWGAIKDRLGDGDEATAMKHAVFLANIKVIEHRSHGESSEELYVHVVTVPGKQQVIGVRTSNDMRNKEKFTYINGKKVEGDTYRVDEKCVRDGTKEALLRQDPAWLDVKIEDLDQASIDSYIARGYTQLNNKFVYK